MLCWQLTISGSPQIRIVRDETEAPSAQENGVNGNDPPKQGKKKKPHRGYAFVVYEREKDMKGTASPIDRSRNFVEVCMIG